MKRAIITAGIIFTVAFIGHAQALVKETKDVVYFNGLGNYEVSRTVNMTDNDKNVSEKTHFKGEGLIKGAIAKMILKSQEQREIMQIKENKRFEIKPDKKVYRVFPLIMKDTAMPDMSTMNGTGEPDTAEAVSENNQQEESDIEVVRNEFTVTPTDEYKDLNGFKCRKYNMLWLTELRNKKTDEHVIDSLFTEIWTTPKSGSIEQAQGIEDGFNKNYLGGMGFDSLANTNMVLGTTWIDLFKQTGEESNMEKPDASTPDAIKEMNKIEGVPIVIDGKFFVLSDKKTEEKPEEKKDKSLNVKKRLGGFLRRAVEKKKEKPKGPQPAITYHTEVVRWEVTSPQTDWFTVPSDYRLQK